MNNSREKKKEGSNKKNTKLQKTDIKKKKLKSYSLMPLNEEKKKNSFYQKGQKLPFHVTFDSL